MRYTALPNGGYAQAAQFGKNGNLIGICSGQLFFGRIIEENPFRVTILAKIEVPRFSRPERAK
jgi:hypothetical protein